MEQHICINCKIIYNQTGYQYIFDLAGERWQTRLHETEREAFDDGMKMMADKMSKVKH